MMCVGFWIVLMGKWRRFLGQEFEAVPGIVIRPAAWDLFSSASITNTWSQAHFVRSILLGSFVASNLVLFTSEFD